ncbi:GAF domain-containing protein [Halobaculum sp. CBA1158]|uniref:GAF domain-containing protein n=1 Tax=Halobaculum sp. CBA1158 TaxID=2904243 RepID=UPI001F2763AB|nr:GAF domain-containing protein [Halobaculum sp. CBA1158]UIP00761.1 GAF domain-containing protein [Halobaculum sp. CBA1158]
MPDVRRPRILLATPDASADGDRIADELEAEIDCETIVRGGETVVEFLRELGPTIDCVICCEGEGCEAAALAETDPTMPIVVYGDTAPSAPVDAVVARDGGTSVLGRQVLDRIERSRERDRLAEANAKLSALNTYTRELTGCETVEGVSETVVDAVTEALGHGEVVLAMRDGDEFYPYGHTFPEDFDATLGTDEGVIGRTYQTEETQIVDDYRADPDRARDIETRSVVSVPVGDHGVLQVTSDHEGAFDERDAEFVEIVASHAAEALARLQRESDLRVERDRLQYFFEGIRAPAVYVESGDGGDPVLAEVNSAYEGLFGSDGVGRPVSEAFPTATEREVFGSDGPDEVAHRDITRESDDGPEDLIVGMVPVPLTGVDVAAFGWYAVDVELP